MSNTTKVQSTPERSWYLKGRESSSDGHSFEAGGYKVVLKDEMYIPRTQNELSSEELYRNFVKESVNIIKPSSLGWELYAQVPRKLKGKRGIVRLEEDGETVEWATFIPDKKQTVSDGMGYEYELSPPEFALIAASESASLFSTFIADYSTLRSKRFVDSAQYVGKFYDRSVHLAMQLDEDFSGLFRDYEVTTGMLKMIIDESIETSDSDKRELNLTTLQERGISEDTREFVRYVLDYYGENGLLTENLGGVVTTQWVITSIKVIRKEDGKIDSLMDNRKYYRRRVRNTLINLSD